MHMKQKGIGKRDTDDGYGVGSPKKRTPVCGVEAKQTNNRDKEIAGVPANHRHRQSEEQAFQDAQPLAARKKLGAHPEWKEGAETEAN